MALREILNDPDLRVEALLTTITRDYDRVSMHGVRRALLERQADSLGIPLHQIPISKSATNVEYETRMAEAFAIYRGHGQIGLSSAISFWKRSGPIASDCSPGRGCSVYIPSGSATLLP